MQNDKQNDPSKIGLVNIFGWIGVSLALDMATLLAAMYCITSEKHADAAKMTMFAIVVAFTSAALNVILIICLVWRCCRRRDNFQRLLFALACCITVVALVYAGENARARRDWNHFKQAAAVDGEKLEVADFIPPSVADEKNLALTPLLRPCLDYVRTNNSVRWSDTNGRARLLEIQISDAKALTGLGGFGPNARVDLEPLRKYFQSSPQFPQPKTPGTAAEDILLALGKFDGELAELRVAAMTRPDARFALHYDESQPLDILFFHLPPVSGLTRVLVVRAAAWLEMNKPDEALADLKIAIRLSDAVRGEPFLISHLVRGYALYFNLLCVHAGLAQRAWNDSQLAELEQQLSSVDLLREYQHSLRGERSYFLKGIDGFRRDGYRATSYFFEPQLEAKIEIFVSPFLPDALFTQNLLTLSENFRDWILPAVNPQNHQVYPELAGEFKRSLKESSTTPYNIFAMVMLPTLSAAPERVARTQSYLDLARTAIALERYRLAHGEFPEVLDSLAPQFIAQVPHDVIGGQPLKYRRTSDGQFILYSIGWNEKDDGGVTVIPKGGSQPKFEEGDWVWRYPTK